MKIINCIVVDDLKEAVTLLESHIRLIPDLKLKLATTSPFEALQFIKVENIDLVFLDIEMPEFTGLDFIEAMKEIKGINRPKVIFTTAYDKYAIIGYDYGVLYFLEKPIGFRKFKIAIERFISDRNVIETIKIKDFIFIEHDGAKIKLNYNDIGFIQAQGNYLDIHTTSSKISAVYSTLIYFAKELPELQFMKVHRSYLVNISKIKAVKGKILEMQVSDSCIQEVSIGRTYRDSVLQILGIND